MVLKFNWEVFGDDILDTEGVDGKESVSGRVKEVVFEKISIGLLLRLGSPWGKIYIIQCGAFVKRLKD